MLCDRDEQKPSILYLVGKFICLFSKTLVKRSIFCFISGLGTN